MISLHIPYLEKQPIKTSVLFFIMARMLILILQVKYDKFCWNMVKNRFHYERNRISAHIFKVWMFSNIVIDSSSTRVDSSVIDETRVGTLTTRGSTTPHLYQVLRHSFSTVLRLSPKAFSKIILR